jgi:hypothetical protein
MQKGKAADGNDVLYIPFSYLRKFLASGAGSLAASTSSAAIYHF